MDRVPATGPSPPPQAPGAQTGIARAATSSLMLAVIAPASIFLTFPVALIGLMGAADAGKHTLLSWLAPLIFWSLPVLIGIISISLALSTIRKLGCGSESGRVAVRSLWISSIVFIIGFFVTLRFMHNMAYFQLAAVLPWRSPRAALQQFPAAGILEGMSESPETPQPQHVPRQVTPGTQASYGTYGGRPVSFVRRGTRLQGRRQAAWELHAERWAVNVPRHVANTSVHPDYTFDAEAEFGRKAPLIVEIGSGLGDAICHAAEQNPDTDFLAVEVYTPGLANTLIKINSRGLSNVRVVEANAPEVLATMLPEGSVSELWVFFPDPWHKSRHHKRRLIQPEFAALAARALKKGGLWRIATDWSNYAVHVRDVLAGSQDFENLHTGERRGPESPLTQVWQSGVESVVGGAPVREGRAPVSTEHTGPNEGVDETGGWAPRFEGRIRTSFEAKAHEAGRLIFDLCYRRR